jgi:recombination protein RecA
MSTALQYQPWDEFSANTEPVPLPTTSVVPLWRKIEDLSLGNLAREGLVRPATRLPDRRDPELVPTGVAELDQLVGGFSCGALNELCGPASSGRTTAMLAALAVITRGREHCALIDVSDSFDPASAVSAGVDLKRLLWIRCSSTPSKPARKATDETRILKTTQKTAYARLEQALKATDLLLQAGGFGMIVVDLGDIRTAVARKVPLTSWFRFRRAVENTRTALLLLEREANAKSCASLVLKFTRAAQDINRELPSHACLLENMNITAEVIRWFAMEKKRPHSVKRTFEAQAQWKRKAVPRCL